MRCCNKLSKLGIRNCIFAGLKAIITNVNRSSLFSLRYGLDAPYVVVCMLAVGGLLLGVAAYFWVSDPSHFNSWDLLWPMSFWLVGGWMLLYSGHIKLRHRYTLLRLAGVRPGDRVLDVGTGLGLLAVAAAKMGAEVVALDKWSTWDLSGNGRCGLERNARAEGVQLQVVDGDACDLPFPDGAFDVVVSNFVVHNIKGHRAREQAVAEMWRVLRPCGRLVISDIHYVKAYAEHLRPLADAMEIRSYYYTFPFSKVLVARKPCGNQG